MECIFYGIQKLHIFAQALLAQLFGVFTLGRD